MDTFFRDRKSVAIKFLIDRLLYRSEWIYVCTRSYCAKPSRPACPSGDFFIQKANEFKSSIWVEKEERRVNAKSLLGVLSLGIVGGTQIRIIADGTDEQNAVDELVKLVRSGFTE